MLDEVWLEMWRGALKPFSSDDQSTGPFIILHDSLWPVPQDSQNIVSQNKTKLLMRKTIQTPAMFLLYICRVSGWQLFLGVPEFEIAIESDAELHFEFECE